MGRTRPFECPYCTKVQGTPKGLIDHLLNEVRARAQYVCRMCGFTQNRSNRHKMSMDEHSCWASNSPHIVDVTCITLDTVKALAKRDGVTSDMVDQRVKIVKWRPPTSSASLVYPSVEKLNHRGTAVHAPTDVLLSQGAVPEPSGQPTAPTSSPELFTPPIADTPMTVPNSPEAAAVPQACQEVMVANSAASGDLSSINFRHLMDACAVSSSPVTIDCGNGQLHTMTAQIHPLEQVTEALTVPSQVALPDVSQQPIETINYANVPTVNSSELAVIIPDTTSMPVWNANGVLYVRHPVIHVATGALVYIVAPGYNCPLDAILRNFPQFTTYTPPALQDVDWAVCQAGPLPFSSMCNVVQGPTAMAHQLSLTAFK